MTIMYLLLLNYGFVYFDLYKMFTRMVIWIDYRSAIKAWPWGPTESSINSQSILPDIYM